MATNRIERVLRHDGIVAVLDMTGDASPAADPSPAPAPAPTSGFGAPAATPPPGLSAVPAPAPAAAPMSPAPAAPAASAGSSNQSVQWVGDQVRRMRGHGDHKVMVSGDDRHVIGVVFIKGHPVVKSVVRMVRQLLRQPSAPSQGL